MLCKHATRLGLSFNVHCSSCKDPAKEDTVSHLELHYDIAIEIYESECTEVYTGQSENLSLNPISFCIINFLILKCPFIHIYQIFHFILIKQQYLKLKTCKMFN